MAKKTQKTSAKSESCCASGPCKGCTIIIPIIIIILLWASTALWSKIIITILAVIIALGKFCPCHKK